MLLDRLERGSRAHPLPKYAQKFKKYSHMVDAPSSNTLDTKGGYQRSYSEQERGLLLHLSSSAPLQKGVWTDATKGRGQARWVDHTAEAQGTP